VDTPARPVLVLVGTQDLGDLAVALAEHQLTPLVTPRAEAAVRILGQLPVAVAVLAVDASGWTTLLDPCRVRRVPTLLTGPPAALAASDHAHRVDLHLPAPVGTDVLTETIVLATTLSVADAGMLRVGRLVVDVPARRATLEDAELLLPPKEFDLLVALARQAGRPVPTEGLLRTVWADEPGMTAQDVHWHVWRLRQLLEAGGEPAVQVVNRRGYGYLLERSEPGSGKGHPQPDQL
jgi:hypothetical protein